MDAEGENIIDDNDVKRSGKRTGEKSNTFYKVVEYFYKFVNFYKNKTAFISAFLYLVNNFLRGNFNVRFNFTIHR